MNTERMRALADLIEKHDRFAYAEWCKRLTDKHTVSAFDLLDDCSTVGCMAGWAAVAAIQDRDNHSIPVDRLRHAFHGVAFLPPVAVEWLEIDDLQAEELFYGGALFEREWFKGLWDQATAADAARLLRDLADEHEAAVS